MDCVEQRNLSIKHYLERTAKIDQTNRDILVDQIIQALETENEYPKHLDFCQLYDMEEDDVIRILAREHDEMQVRIKMAEINHNKQNQFDW